MSRCPFAVWRPLPENATQPRIVPTQVILHSAVDAPGRTSLFGFFRDSSPLESTFYVYFDGTIEQYMDTEVRADANNMANVRAVSIETEDDGDPNRTPWSDAQVKSIVRLLTWLCIQHDIPPRRCPAWDQPGIGYHAMWGAPSEWTPVAGKTCPGIIRIAQFTKIVQAVATPIDDEEDMPTNFTEKTVEDWSGALREILQFSRDAPGAFRTLLARTGDLDDVIRDVVKDAIAETGSDGVDAQAVADAVVAKISVKLGSA